MSELRSGWLRCRRTDALRRDKGDSPTAGARGPSMTLPIVPFPTTLQPPGQHRQAELVPRARDEQTIAVGRHRDRLPAWDPLESQPGSPCGQYESPLRTSPPLIDPSAIQVAPLIVSLMKWTDPSPN